MKALDLSGPPPHPKTLAEAEQVIETLWEVIGELRERIDTLEDAGVADSRTSSRPPSSDTPEQRQKRRKKPRSSKSRGAQPGHPKHERLLVAEGEVDEVERLYPPGICECGQALTLEPDPGVRHQVFDLPPVRYRVTEYQLYRGECRCCERTVIARLPDWVPSGQMGPGLIAWIGVLAGEFHLSVRGIQRFLVEQWSLSFSIGAISLCGPTRRRES